MGGQGQKINEHSLAYINVDGTRQKSDWDSKDGRAEADEDDYFKKVSSSDSQTADSLLLWSYKEF